MVMAGLVTACVSVLASAQEAAPRAAATPSLTAEPSCTYTRCALGIAPRWNGLDLVRGEREERVRSLGFFWPRDVSSAFDGDQVAVGHARIAVRQRRIGAALTDAGGLLLVAAAARLLTDGRMDRTGGLLAGGGAMLLGASIPLQFAADAELSRAVWRYNARFGR